MSTSVRKEWRRTFTETIMEMAQGRVDVLEAASWALEAQHAQSHRDPEEVAREQFNNVARDVDTPAPGKGVSILMAAPSVTPEFLLTRPDQNRLDTRAP